MCVAAVIFKPVSASDLTDMENSNPHGAGVAWVQDGKMHWLKGLKASEIFTMQQEGKLPLPYLLHFRWATVGAKVPELTHPFPLGIQALFPVVSGSAKAVLIHNGSWAPKIAWEDRLELPDGLFEHLSDTAFAAYLAEGNESILDKVAWATCVGRVDAAGNLDVTTRGTWEKYEGNWYSNTNWRTKCGWSDWASNHLKYKGYTGSSYYSGDSRLPRSDKDWDDYLDRRYGDQTKKQGQFRQIEDWLKTVSPRTAPGCFQDLPFSSGDLSEGQWSRYMDAKYPASSMEELPDTDDEDEKVTFDQMMADMDMVSEDAAEVNEILGRMALAEMGGEG